MPKRKGVFSWYSFPNCDCDDASAEGDLFDRPGNKRGAGVRDGLATAGAEGGLDTIFGLFDDDDHCDEHLAHCDRVH